MDSFPCVSEARVPGSIPGGSTLSRISPEREAVCKTVVAGSTPERGSIFGGGAHAMDAPLAGASGHDGDAAGVEHPVRPDAEQLRAGAAAVQPVELAGCVRVGVYREYA